MVLGILDSPCFLILLIYNIHKDNKMKSWLTPCSHSLEGELIHWQCVAIQWKCCPQKLHNDILPLALQSFSRSIASTPIYINSKLDLLSLPSLVFNEKFAISEWTSKHMFCPTREWTWFSVSEIYFATIRPQTSNATVILWQFIHNNKFQGRHPADILLSWSNATYFLSLNSTPIP